MSDGRQLYMCYELRSSVESVIGIVVAKMDGSIDIHIVYECISSSGLSSRMDGEWKRGNIYK